MGETAWLWVGVAGMTVGAAVLLVTGPRGSKDEHNHTILHSFVPMVAAALYLLMALGQGSLTLGGGREFLYARYVDWTITTPLLLFALSKTALGEARTRGGLVFALLGADVYMILTGLVAGLSPSGSEAKWIWYLVSCGAFLAVYFVLWGPMLKEARARSANAAEAYVRHATILSVLWFLYPVVFLVGPDGAGMITPVLATLLFLILDLTTKVIYAFVTYASTKKVSQTSPSENREPVLA